MLNVEKYSIAVVGGTGYIGSSLTRNLSKKYDVVVVDVREPTEKIIGSKFKQCDIRKYDEVIKAIGDCDLVVHTAIVQIPLINENKKLGYEVNFLGTANICRAVQECPKIKGMILSGTWHTMGERGLSGVITEEFGFRPDMVEDRARLYALSKMAQEAIVRFHSEMSDKIFGIVRMGTVLGEGMPEKTAANIFIDQGLKGESLTPFLNSAYRPMLYVDVADVGLVYEILADQILKSNQKPANCSSYIVNVYYPVPITILELAEIIRDAIEKFSNGKNNLRIELIDQGKPLLFKPQDKERITVDITKAKYLLGIENLIPPRESIERIVKNRLTSSSSI
jgi:nucleoside-diphosphate-sugar epimerase